MVNQYLTVNTAVFLGPYSEIIFYGKKHELKSCWFIDIYLKLSKDESPILIRLMYLKTLSNNSNNCPFKLHTGLIIINVVSVFKLPH